jgi:hypothetical protein
VESNYPHLGEQNLCPPERISVHPAASGAKTSFRPLPPFGDSLSTGQNVRQSPFSGSLSNVRESTIMQISTCLGKIAFVLPTWLLIILGIVLPLGFLVFLFFE